MSNALINAHTRTMKHLQELFADKERGGVSIEFLFISVAILAVAALAAAAFRNKAVEFIDQLMGS